MVDYHCLSREVSNKLLALVSSASVPSLLPALMVDGTPATMHLPYSPIQWQSGKNDLNLWMRVVCAATTAVHKPGCGVATEKQGGGMGWPSTTTQTPPESNKQNKLHFMYVVDTTKFGSPGSRSVGPTPALLRSGSAA